MRKRLGWLLRIGLTVLLFALLFTRVVNLNELWNEVRQANVAWLAVAWLAQAAAVACSILRWDVLLKGQGIVVPFGHLTSTFLVGRFFGTFLPSTIGLDAYRAYDIAARTGETARSVAVIVVEKIIGFFALCGMIVVTLPFGASFISTPVIVALLGLFALPVTLSFVLLLRPAALYRVLRLPFPAKPRLEPRLRKAIDAVSLYHNQPRRLWTAALLGVGVHLGAVMMYFCIAMSLNASVTLGQMLIAGPLIIASTVGLPTIGGEGARELSAIALLTSLVGGAKAFLIAHLGFWIGLSISLIGGVLYLLRPANYRPEITMTSVDSTVDGRPEEHVPLQLPSSGVAGQVLEISRTTAQPTAEGGTG